MQLARRRRLLLAVLALALLAGAATAYTSYKRSPGIHYPHELPGGYTVAQIVSGQDAVELVKSIHWNPAAINASKALIIVYSDGTRVWITEVKGDACSYVALMAGKMRAYSNQLPYTPPAPHTIGQTTVYLSMDKRDGRLHAFWCKNRLVIWAELGASGPQALPKLVNEIG